MTKELTYQELTAKRDEDFDLCMAMGSALENALDLGIEEDTEELETEVARQVNGWLWNGREW